MQHGGILLACSPHTPNLPGIRELTGQDLDVRKTCQAIQRYFMAEMRWNLVAEECTSQERQRIEEVTLTKYRKAAWNDRR